MLACESKLASRSSTKAPQWPRLYLLSRSRSRDRTPSLVGDGGQVLQVLGWALTRIRNLPLVRYSQTKGAVRWLCAEQSRELFSDIKGRGGASNEPLP